MAYTPIGETISFITNPETRDKWIKRTKAAAKVLGASAVAGTAVVMGIGHGVENGSPVEVTTATIADGGKQEVTDLNLELNEVCITGFTATVTDSSAKLETNVEVLGNKVDLLSPWRTNTVNFEAEGAFCMGGNTAKGSYDPNTKHMIVKIDPEKLYTRVTVLQDTVSSSPTQSPNALPLNLTAEIIKGTFLNDVEVVRGVAKTDNAVDSYLTNAATLTGLNAIVDNCVPQVVPLTQPAIKNTVRSNVLAVADQIEKGIKVDVLIGTQTLENPDEPQAISDGSNVKESFEKLSQAKNTVVSAGNMGDCNVPDELKKSNEPVSSQNNGAEL